MLNEIKNCSNAAMMNYSMCKVTVAEYSQCLADTDAAFKHIGEYVCNQADGGPGAGATPSCSKISAACPGSMTMGTGMPPPEPYR